MTQDEITATEEANARRAVIEAKLEAHMKSCEGFTKLVLAALGIAITVNISALGFLFGEIYSIRGARNAIVERLSTIDKSIVAAKESADDRLTGITTSNLQREATFNERFREIRTDIDQLRKEWQALDERYYGKKR